MNRKTFLTRITTGAAVLTAGTASGIAGKPTSPEVLTPSLPNLDWNDWEAVRELFPLTRERLYFNTGGLGPPSRPVLEAMEVQARIQAVMGETHHGLLHNVRTTAARFLQANPEEIAFNRNASEGNSIIAAGLDLKAGDEVIFESHAHPGGSFPWMNRQKRDGIRVRIFEPDTEKPENNLERIFDLVNERTRVIQISHLTAPTGILFDAAAIAREARKRGIWFHIDGAQSAGMIPVDLHGTGCDSYATSGHKWLNGPQETGILYICHDRMAEVACSHAGAYSESNYELPDKFSYHPTVQRHEYGTRNPAPFVGLETAIKIQEKIGPRRIAKHGKQLVDQSREALSRIPGLKILTPEHSAMYNSMLTFRLKGKRGKDVARELVTNHNLRCREVNERGLNAVRVSWHVYHREEDVERLADGIRAVR